MTLEQTHTDLAEILAELGIDGCDAGVLAGWIHRRRVGREPLPLDTLRRLHKLTEQLITDAEAAARGRRDLGEWLGLGGVGKISPPPSGP